MKVNTSIFRSYDIRGIFPEELDKEMAFKIGQAFVEYTKAKHIVVGRDMRLSSPELFEALTKGIVSTGSDVYNIGLVPTEALYFSVANYDYDAGIMITASHNPKEYNGFKLVVDSSAGERDGFLDFVRGKDLADLVQNEIKEKQNPPVGGLGEIKEKNIWGDFNTHLLSQVNLTEIKPLKIVIDAGSGMAGKVIPLIQENLPVEIIPLNFELDGSFPAHPSNPLEDGVTNQISEEVKKQKADAGFIFDGDADRIYLIDEKGNFVSGDMTLLLLAKYLLAKDVEKGIAYNLICSKAVPEFITKWGGTPVRTPVGVVNVRDGMIKNDGILGGELSGHYMLRESFYLDSGFVVFLMLLQIFSQSDQKISDQIKKLSLYFKSSELSFKVEDKEKTIKKFRELFSDGKQDEMDGLTVEYKDWWFNVRPSNTEPLLRLTIEANTKKLLESKIKKLTSLI